MAEVGTDVNSGITPKVAAPSLSITAAAGQDGQAQVGTIIDTYLINHPRSMSLLFPFTTTLAAAATLKFKSMIVEHSDAADLSGAATFATLEASAGTTIATGPGGGGTVAGVKKYGVNLGGAKRYIRVTYTPDLSAANTDTAVIGAAVAVCAGEYVQPAV